MPAFLGCRLHGSVSGLLHCSRHSAALLTHGTRGKFFHNDNPAQAANTPGGHAKLENVRWVRNMAGVFMLFLNCTYSVNANFHYCIVGIYYCTYTIHILTGISKCSFSGTRLVINSESAGAVDRWCIKRVHLPLVHVCVKYFACLHAKPFVTFSMAAFSLAIISISFLTITVLQW